jgi:hypothetical protein
MRHRAGRATGFMGRSYGGGTKESSRDDMLGHGLVIEPPNVTGVLCLCCSQLQPRHFLLARPVQLSRPGQCAECALVSPAGQHATSLFRQSISQSSAGLPGLICKQKKLVRLRIAWMESFASFSCLATTTCIFVDLCSGRSFPHVCHFQQHRSRKRLLGLRYNKERQKS